MVLFLYFTKWSPVDIQTWLEEFPTIRSETHVAKLYAKLKALGRAKRRDGQFKEEIVLGRENFHYKRINSTNIPYRCARMTDIFVQRKNDLMKPPHQNRIPTCLTKSSSLPTISLFQPSLPHKSRKTTIFECVRAVTVQIVKPFRKAFFIQHLLLR